MFSRRLFGATCYFGFEQFEGGQLFQSIIPFLLFWLSEVFGTARVGAKDVGKSKGFSDAMVRILEVSHAYLFVSLVSFRVFSSVSFFLYPLHFEQ